MSQLRIMIDIILDDTPQAEGRINGWWNQFKTDRASFKKILKTDEESIVEVHRCFHDEDPTRECEIKKLIELNTIKKEDDL